MAGAVQVGRCEHCFSRNATKRQDSHILLAISEVELQGRAGLLKKHNSESGLNQRDEDAHDFFVKQIPVVPPEIKNPDRGCPSPGLYAQHGGGGGGLANWLSPPA